MKMPFTDIEEARKNRERIEEMRRKEVAGVKSTPLRHKQPISQPQHVEIITKLEDAPQKQILATVPKIVKRQPIAKSLEDYEPSITHEEFFGTLKKVCSPIKEKLATLQMEPATEAGLPKDASPSDRLGYGLHLLKEDTIRAFKQAFDQRCSKYDNRPEVAIDAYYEVLVERNELDNIRKELLHWHKYLSALPDCQHTRGARQILSTLAELCDAIIKMRPSE